MSPPRESCVSCWTPIKKGWVALECDHVICPKCFNRWLEKCSVCQRNVHMHFHCAQKYEEIQKQRQGCGEPREKTIDTRCDTPMDSSGEQRVFVLCGLETPPKSLSVWATSRLENGSTVRNTPDWPHRLLSFRNSVHC